jgi:hypothetical protein
MFNDPYNRFGSFKKLERLTVVNTWMGKFAAGLRELLKSLRTINLATPIPTIGSDANLQAELLAGSKERPRLKVRFAGGANVLDSLGEDEESFCKIVPNLRY